MIKCCAVLVFYTLVWQDHSSNNMNYINFDNLYQCEIAARQVPEGKRFVGCIETVLVEPSAYTGENGDDSKAIR